MLLLFCPTDINLSTNVLWDVKAVTELSVIPSEADIAKLVK